MSLFQRRRLMKKWDLITFSSVFSFCLHCFQAGCQIKHFFCGLRWSRQKCKDSSQRQCQQSFFFFLWKGPCVRLAETFQWWPRLLLLSAKWQKINSNWWESCITHPLKPVEMILWFIVHLHLQSTMWIFGSATIAITSYPDCMISP